MRMIRQIKNVTCSNPHAQIWKHLRFFLDLPYTVKRIKEIHNIHDSKHERNIKKQAEQINYCILQAEEYYKAAEHVSVAIKPLLLYYGSVALSQALVLLSNAGELSFDYRRKTKKHSHHGLELKEFPLPSKLSEAPLQDILRLIRCNIYLKENTPWGQFGLFYNSLVPSAFSISLRYRQVDEALFETPTQAEEIRKQLQKQLQAVMHKGGYTTHFIPHGCAELLPIDSIKNNVFTCFDLSTMLADCYSTFQELGIRPQICRGSLDAEVFEGYKIDEKGNKIVVELVEDHSASINGINETEEAQLLSLLAAQNSPFKMTEQVYNPLNLQQREVGDHSLVLHARITYRSREERDRFYYPDIVDDLHGNLYYIIEPEKYIHEPGSLFIIQFCFGMLSRYYPDIWMKLVKEHTIFREFTDTLLLTIRLLRFDLC